MSSTTAVKDPVCGMDVETATAALWRAGGLGLVLFVE